MPGSYSLFLEDCKDVYDGRCQDFKAMLDRLETCEVEYELQQSSTRLIPRSTGED